MADIMQYGSHTNRRRRHPHGNVQRPIMNDTMTKAFDGVLCDVMVKTSLEQVYDLDTDKTLVELLAEIGDGMIDTKELAEKTYAMVEEILSDAPESMNTFKEVWDYIRLSGDPKSALIQFLEPKFDAKVDKEEGKGLSTHDLTDILYQKLVEDYTKEELDERFQIVIDDYTGKLEVIAQGISQMNARIVKLEEEPNIRLTRNPGEIPEGCVEGDVFAVLVDTDPGATGAIFS